MSRPGSPSHPESSSQHTVDSAGTVIDWPKDSTPATNFFPDVELILVGADLHIRTGTAAELTAGTQVKTFSQSTTAAARMLKDGAIIPDFRRRFPESETKLGFRCQGTAAPTGQINTDTVGTAVTPVDGDDFILDDGTNPAVTFEFDEDGSVVETPTLRQVDIMGAGDEDDVRDLMVTAVNNAPTLLISAAPGGAGLVDFTHDEQGIAGNVAIVENVANVNFSVVSGMSGGTGETCTLVINPGVGTP